MRLGFVLAGAVVVVGGLLGLRWLDRASTEAQAARLASYGDTICPDWTPVDLPPDSTRLAAVFLGVGGVFAIRGLVRLAKS